MNKISDQIMEGMKTAMKAKDTVTLNTLRALKTALTNTAIAKGGLGTLLEEAEELAVVRKQIKQREDSAEQFRSAGRPELAETTPYTTATGPKIKNRKLSAGWI